VTIYTSAAHKLAGWVATNHDVTSWADIERGHIQDFTILVLENAPRYANHLFRALQQFARWYAAEYEAPNPMLGMSPPMLGLGVQSVPWPNAAPTTILSVHEQANGTMVIFDGEVRPGEPDRSTFVVPSDVESRTPVHLDAATLRSLARARPEGYWQLPLHRRLRWWMWMRGHARRGEAGWLHIFGYGRR
jgi:hypothetical protein